MRKLLQLIVISLFSGTLLISCGGAKADEKPRLVRASAPQLPDWVLKKKKSAEDVYFVGMSQKLGSLKESKRSAVSDATAQLVEYIGFRATSKKTATRTSTEGDAVSAFQNNIIETLEGKGSASVSVDEEDSYFEEYSDGSVQVYTLIKLPVKWVETERKRLQKIVADQRSQAEGYIRQADAAIETGELAKALDLALNALGIAEKTAENSDLYDQSKNQITLILSGMALKMESEPKYAYSEGGSDDIIIRAVSSKTGKGVSGFSGAAKDQSANAEVISKTGGVSDKDGLFTFTVSKMKTAEAGADVVVTFSLAKFEPVKKTDEEFYARIQKMATDQSVRIKIQGVSRDKVVPTGLLVFDFIREGKQVKKAGLSPEFQESLSGKLASAGYNIIATEIPADVIREGREEGQVRNAVINYLKANYPGVKRIMLGMRDVNDLGQMGKDITFNNSDLNLSDLMIVDIKFTLSLISVETSKVEKGITLSVKGQGLNTRQAVQNASRRLLERVETQMGELQN